MLTVTNSVPLCTIQDAGRGGVAHLGVGRCGALDSEAMRLANIALGNPRDAACVEILRGSLAVRADTAQWVCALGCNTKLTLARSGAERAHVQPGMPTMLLVGDSLSVSSRGGFGCSYLALAGGVDCPAILGSCSTDLAGGFGGLKGLALGPGNTISAGPCNSAQHKLLSLFRHETASYAMRKRPPDNTLRALPGPEYRHLDEKMQQAFWHDSFILGSEGNRMGIRFRSDGSNSRDHSERSDTMANMASHAVLPGTVQALPGGEFIALLADAQTTGGYPRIANIITADLWQLAQLPPGSAVEFLRVGPEEAALALTRQSELLARAGYSVQHLINTRPCQA